MVSIPVVFILVNPRTCDGILLLLYYAQDLVIQIDINNKSIPQAYASQTQTCKEFKKLELIKLSINIWIVARQIEKLKTWWRLQSSPN
jgi:hypothetical protein